MARQDPHSTTDTEQGRVVHLALDWRVDFAARRIGGSATLELAAAASGPLDLDTRDLTIEAVTDDAGRAVPFALGERDPVLGQRLRLTLARPSARVTVRYQTSPEATALQWLEPAQTAGGAHPYLFSQCQAIHARSLAPMQDSPGVRLTYAAKVTVPAALSAVMSAAPGEVAASGGGERVFSFTMPQPIPSYLLALAVGNLARQDLGPRSCVYTEPEMLAKAAWEFAEVDRLITAAEQLFGPYRWERFDFLVMPPSFPYGGMENPRLTFLTPTLLAGDRSLVNVLAHELAHSWTGNLVTNATMNDFWLNEGFTVWAERRILEAIAGVEAQALAAAIGLGGLKEDVARFGAESPYTRLRTDLGGVDPDEVFSRVPYEKGALLVFRLEQAVGRQRWDRFVRDYMDRFGFTSLTTDQFVAFLDERLPGVGAEIGLGRWLDAPGLPDDAPVFRSARLEELQTMARRFAAGERPPVKALEAFSAEDWQIFLQELPKRLPVESCAWLDETFALSRRGNAEILAGWLVIAASSAYAPAFAPIRAFLGAYGRMKFLKPLYRALHQGPTTRALAAEVFAAYAHTYHPIARAGIERLLKE